MTLPAIKLYKSFSYCQHDVNDIDVDSGNSAGSGHEPSPVPVMKKFEASWRDDPALARQALALFQRREARSWTHAAKLPRRPSPSSSLAATHNKAKPTGPRSLTVHSPVTPPPLPAPTTPDEAFERAPTPPPPPQHHSHNRRQE